MSSEPTDFEHLIKQLLSYQGDDATPYIEKYDKSWLVQIIEETDQLQKIEIGFNQHGPHGIDLIDFTRVMLNILPHEENETLYIAIASIDLFKDICETFNLKNLVKSKDILNYVVENFLSKDPNTHTIPTRKMPEKKKFGEKPWTVREIDINAPIIYGNITKGIRRLKNKVIADRTHHNSSIKRACFGDEVKRVFTLDPLGDHISVYDLNCILDRKIYPKNLNEKGDIMVLDFAWSNKQQRVKRLLI